MGWPWCAGKGEVVVDEIFGQTLQRAEVRQFFFGTSAEEKVQFAAVKLARLAQAPTPLGHGAHGGAACAGANHDDVGFGVVGHQKAAAKRADDLNGVAHF